MNEQNPRRAFLAAAGAGVAGLGFTAIAPGLHLMAVGEANAAARPVGQAASPAIRWGLLIDANKCAPGCTKCIGCHICADVCPTGYIQMGLGE